MGVCVKCNAQQNSASNLIVRPKLEKKRWYCVKNVDSKYVVFGGVKEKFVGIAREKFYVHFSHLPTPTHRRCRSGLHPSPHGMASSYARIQFDSLFAHCVHLYLQLRIYISELIVLTEKPDTIAMVGRWFYRIVNATVITLCVCHLVDILCQLLSLYLSSLNLSFSIYKSDLDFIRFNRMNNL